MLLRKEDSTRIAIFTTSETFSSLYDMLRQHGDAGKVVCCVVPINRQGHDKIEKVLACCQRLGIKTLWQPFKKDVEPFNVQLRELGVTMGISWSYSQIIQPSTLELFTQGIWNMHGGKIPEYRGANVLQWAIANGETELGVSWHLMNKQVDAGDILMQGVVPVSSKETALEAREKIFDEGIRLFGIMWDDFCRGGLKTYPVDISEGSSYRSRNIADGQITSDMDITQIRNLLRAQCPPWPAPIVKMDGEWYDVLAVREKRREGKRREAAFDADGMQVFLQVQKHQGPSSVIESCIEKNNSSKRL